MTPNWPILASGAQEALVVIMFIALRIYLWLCMSYCYVADRTYAPRKN